MIETGADIQVENGNWAKVHNTILKKLALTKLDGREAKCLFFLFSMTYGKREKEHAISLSLWASGTDLDKRNVARVVDGLVERNIIYRIGNGRGRGSIAVYGFNKHFEKWDIPAEKVSSMTPIEKVSPETPLNEEKVSPMTPEKVSPMTPTIERKAEKPAAAKRAISDFAQAYQDILGKMVESRTRSEEIQDWEKRIPYAAWEYALRESLDKGHRNDWKYTKSILSRLEREGYQPSPPQVILPVVATVNFALEELV